MLAPFYCRGIYFAPMILAPLEPESKESHPFKKVIPSVYV